MRDIICCLSLQWKCSQNELLKAVKLPLISIEAILTTHYLGYIFWYKGIAIKVYLIWKELDYNWCLCERRVRIIWYCRKVTMYFWHTKRMYQQLGRAHWLCSFDDNWYSAFLLLINRSSKRKKIFILLIHLIWQARFFKEHWRILLPDHKYLLVIIIHKECSNMRVRIFVLGIQ